MSWTYYTIAYFKYNALNETMHAKSQYIRNINIYISTLNKRIKVNM